jgi:hypothetical protein
MTMADTICTCDRRDWAWYPDPTDEAGWTCCYCDGKAPGDPPGFRPDLDREWTDAKVDAILNAAHEAELIYISSSDEGEYLVRRVVRACHAAGHFDSYSILRAIMEEETPGHAAYWGGIGEGVMCGSDPRPRCWCGRLSMCSRGSGHYCDEHRGDIFGDPIEAPGPGGSHV